MWTRLCNLQMECNIPPLYSRITALNVHVIVRALSQPRDVPFNNRVKIELRRNPYFPIPNTWIAGMGKAARKCNLCKELLSRKPSSLNEVYGGRAPWEESPATFNFTELPNSKANCTEQQLKGAAEEAMRKVYTEGCREYFTDGSVDNSIPTTGAGVFSTNFSGSWRLSNTCSPLQTELIAVLKALEHSLNNGNGAVVIHRLQICLAGYSKRRYEGEFPADVLHCGLSRITQGTKRSCLSKMDSEPYMNPQK